MPVELDVGVVSVMVFPVAFFADGGRGEAFVPTGVHAPGDAAVAFNAF